MGLYESVYSGGGNVVSGFTESKRKRSMHVLKEFSDPMPRGMSSRLINVTSIRMTLKRGTSFILRMFGLIRCDRLERSLIRRRLIHNLAFFNRLTSIFQQQYSKKHAMRHLGSYSSSS